MMPTAGSFQLESEHIHTCMSSPGTITHTTWAGTAPLMTFEHNKLQVQVSADNTVHVS